MGLLVKKGTNGFGVPPGWGTNDEMGMFGEPVVMRDREGNVVRGRRLFYFMDDGKVEIKGGGEGLAPAPAASAGGTQ